MLDLYKKLFYHSTDSFKRLVIELLKEVFVIKQQAKTSKPYKESFVKPFILMVLLVPLSISADNLAQIKQFKLNKEVELSELGKAISDKYEYIESIRQKGIAILRYEVNRKNLSNQEAKEYGKSVDNDLVVFITRLEKSPTINGFLVSELFKCNKDEPLEDFEMIKFCVIRIINEYRILKTLIERYEILEQEHREITQKMSVQN